MTPEQQIREALQPFADFRDWRQAKGIKGHPPALGPREREAAADALAALDRLVVERDALREALPTDAELARLREHARAARDRRNEMTGDGLWTQYLQHIVTIADNLAARGALAGVPADEPAAQQNPTEGRSDEGDGGWDSPATRKCAGAEATSESVVPPSSEPSPARAHEAAGGDPGNAPAGRELFDPKLDHPERYGGNNPWRPIS